MQLAAAQGAQATMAAEAQHQQEAMALRMAEAEARVAALQEEAGEANGAVRVFVLVVDFVC